MLLIFQFIQLTMLTYMAAAIFNFDMATQLMIVTFLAPMQAHTKIEVGKTLVFSS